jgi:hypothetical protein
MASGTQYGFMVSVAGLCGQSSVHIR